LEHPTCPFEVVPPVDVFHLAGQQKSVLGVNSSWFLFDSLETPGLGMRKRASAKEKSAGNSLK
jgi:hypothetical protein